MLGIPSLNQLTATIQKNINDAIAAAGGLEKMTADQIANVAAQGTQDLLQLEAGPLAAANRFLDELAAFRAEVTAFRELIERGGTFISTYKWNPILTDDLPVSPEVK